MRRRILPIAGLVFAALLAAGPVSRADATDAAIRLLARAVKPQHDNSHLLLLFGLRQLRDPTLETLYAELLSVADWQIQVHAVLGLAEVGETRRLDTGRFREIDPRGQEHVLALALDEGLVSDDQVKTLLGWEGLSQLPRLLLLAELITRHEPVDPAALRGLTASEELLVAALATALLRQIEPGFPTDELRSRLRKLARRERQRVLGWLIDAIRQYELSGALDLVLAEMEEPDAGRDLIHQGILAALELAPERGLSVWRRHLATDPSHRQRVRFGLLLLSLGADAPEQAYRDLADGEPLTDAIVKVGLSMQAGAGEAAALNDLLDVGHLPSMRWVVHHAASMPASESAAVYDHLLESIGEEAPPARVEMAVIAVSRLFEIDPDLVLGRLRAARDDGLGQQVILLGLFESEPSDRIGPAAASVPRIGPGRADSMALVLVAKHRAALGPADLAQLGTIAGGGGRVSEVMQVQAAWLYLKHAGKLDDAMERLFPDP